MSEELKRTAEKLEKFKYPLIVLILGVILMLLPGGSIQEKDTADSNQLVAQMLSQTRGVGQARVLISENGVVIVCQGADNAGVRLDIIRAVSSYTGFASDKITILKMAD